MWPGSSVSGVYFAHPDAYYFGVAKVERALSAYEATVGAEHERQVFNRAKQQWLHYLTQHYRCLHSLRNLVHVDFRNLPRSHRRCERHIHHRNQQHLRCFTPTQCPHRSH